MATATLRAAGDLIGIRIVDHLVATEDAHCSSREDDGWADLQQVSAAAGILVTVVKRDVVPSERALSAQLAKLAGADQSADLGTASGQGPIVRASGVTRGERYLGELCRNSFLSLWSYPAPYRDQGAGRGHGKEICDLLVVFGNDIIVFSDKEVAFSAAGDVHLAWQRWFKRAVADSAVQLRGAERWIRSHPTRIYVDRACTVRLPINLPERPRFHRIVVAHGVSERCTTELGGSGSLMIVPELVGPAMPFAVGLPAPDAAFTHVLDDTSLRIVLGTLDTISDFVRYLRAKEELVSSGRLISAAGEEELLACYLSKVDSSGQHAFVFPDGRITIDEGFWEKFSQSPERAAQLEADKVSYVWDDLIERFSHHLLAGTQHFATHPEVHEQEKVLKLLAQETRLARRMLGAALVDMVSSSPPNQRATRVMVPRASDAVTPTHYVVLVLPRPTAEHIGSYREVRRQLLEQYCLLVKLDHSSAKDVIGIAIEPLNSDVSSEDLAYFDARQWTAANAERARNLKSEFIEHGLLSDRTVSTASTSEYPVGGLPVLTRETWSAPTMRGRQRNHPCPCGSGLKYKRCCGRSR